MIDLGVIDVTIFFAQTKLDSMNDFAALLVNKTSNMPFELQHSLTDTLNPLAFGSSVKL